jgi:hypothetical protein
MELTREAVNWGPQRPCQCANMPVEAAPSLPGGFKFKLLHARCPRLRLRDQVPSWWQPGAYVCSGSWRTSQAAVTAEGGSRPGCCRQRDSVGDRPGKSKAAAIGGSSDHIPSPSQVGLSLGYHCTGSALDPSLQAARTSGGSSLTSSSFRPHATLGGLRLGVCTRRRGPEPRLQPASGVLRSCRFNLKLVHWQVSESPAGRRPGVGPFATSSLLP